LEIDEHSADAGVVTRLEAFLDSIRNAKGHAEPEKKVIAKFRLNGDRRKIYRPYMCDHSITLSSAFRACGVEAEVIEQSAEETVNLGRKVTTGKECYPCILTTGDMLKTAMKESFDPSRSAFFMPTGGGPCRFGQYHRFHRMVLDDMGFEDVPIYAPNQDHRFYNELNIVGRKFSRLGWRALVATDLITKMLHETRPYEEIEGSVDQAYKASLDQISRSIEGGGKDIFEVLEDVTKRFLGVKKVKTKKPIIGIVGEIYIRSNKFSNNDLIRKTEEFGGVAWLAPIAEWIAYVNYINKGKKYNKRGFLDMASFALTDYIQKKDEHRLERIFEKYLEYGQEPRIAQIIKKASPYVHVSFEGEAILSVGKTVDFIDKGVSGIINAMPFTCMPGTISSAIMKLIQNKYDIPIINVAYDGQGATNITTRLEAFMYQVKEHFLNRG
jgi:predicted nucleotide-binding protein (sugar kinase/HSP70/actin superfamily)